MRALTIRDLVNAVQGKPIRILLQDAEFDRVQTDSRRVRPGDVFWALTGENHDGHDFIPEAIERGAIACVAEHGRVDTAEIPLIAVGDTHLALWDFASWYRGQLSARIIGVTGSVGKTSTRHMIYSMLSTVLPGTESPGNFNNEIGVPLSLLGIGAEDQFAAIELAAAKAGDIADLTRMARPEIGVITSVAPCHLASFGTLEEIARTKGELLDYLPESGTAILNGDNPWVRDLACFARCNVIQVGTDSSCDLQAEDVRSENGMMKFRVDGIDYSVQVPGTHLLTSALATIAVGREFGLTADTILTGLAEFLPLPGRCKSLSIGEWTVIDDSYNSSPASMAAACNVLQNWQGARRKILVAGDMLELGEESVKFHEELGRQVALSGLDGLIAIGQYGNHVISAAKQAGMCGGCLAYCPSDQVAELLLDCWLDPGSVVLVKGSRALHLENMVEQIRVLATQRVEVVRPHRHAA